LGRRQPLAATGALTISQAVLLLRERRNAMQKPVPLRCGGMAALIEGDDKEVTPTVWGM